MEIGHYTPGIQEKPDPTFNKKNDYYIYYKERLIAMERSKGFISRMFGDNNIKTIKSVIKSNKIKPKNARQIGLLIDNFYEDLDI